MREPKRRRLLTRAAILSLEPRQLLATPGGLQPETFTSFDKGERQALIARMTNLAGRSTYADKIGNGTSARLRDFDDSILSYMQSRSTVNYFFSPNQVQSLGTWITGELNVTKTTEKANKIVDNRLFPATPTSSDYTSSLTGNINYRNPNNDNGGNFTLTVNRFEYWGGLVESVWFAGSQAKYVNELTFQLATWSSQFDSNLDAPTTWNDIGKSGWQFATSIRTDAWTQAYFKLLTTSNTVWSGVDNSLMLYKLMQHGDWLYNQAGTAKVDDSVDSNKTIMLAKALYMLGRMFPEFDTAAAWEDKGRTLLIDSMNAQVYNDGSHREQSPGYALNVADDLLEVYWLDQKNSDTAGWSSANVLKLEKIMESNRQFLSPDGRRPGIGDTSRSLSTGTLLKAGVILDKINPTSTTLSSNYSSGVTTIGVADASSFSVGDFATGAERSELLRVTGKSGNTLTVERGVSGTTAQSLFGGNVFYNLGDQPFAKPSIGDVWLLGQSLTQPFINTPASPEGVLGPRGKAYAMTDSGNYVLRSGDSGRATQLIFDAGPKGGFHGHMDPLNFELWSGGRPLIIDPGGYKYDGGADRDYVISTKAHNTINVDGKNVGWIEGENQPALIASHNFQSNFATVTGTHFGYASMTGQPAITRSIWYNYGDTMLIVDWAESSTSHTYQQSFNVPGDATANVSGATGGSEFKTRYADGSDNVRVKMINGGSLVKGGLTFVTGTDADLKDDAYRYTVSKTGSTAVFVTLVNVYTGLSVPNVEAQLVTSNPQMGQALQVKLIRNGVDEQTVTFQQPNLIRPSSDLNVRGRVNDTEFDKWGNLHVAFQDLNDGHLKYTVKDATTGRWSVVQVVDDSNNNVGAYLDLKLDNENRPAIAYYDQPNGDLKYASMVTQNHAWRSQTVDNKNTVGLNPSLIFSRKGNSAIISYYQRTKQDLRVATQQTTSDWDIQTLDSTGDVGRFSQITLDPNRTDLNSRWSVVYEDATNVRYKYAYTAGDLRFDTIKANGVTGNGGFLSMAWEDSGSGTVGTPTSNRFVPRFTFYENWPDASLWIARKDKTTGNWSTGRVDGTGSTKKVGAYNQLSYASGKAEIFYYDTKNNNLRRVVANGSSWTYYLVAEGTGKDVRPSRFGTQWSVSTYSSIDNSLRILNV
jgi:Heparinase II/III-like protein/Heparinase II/III N-terminus